MRRGLTEREVYRKLEVLERHSAFKQPYKFRTHPLAELNYEWPGYPPPQSPSDPYPPWPTRPPTACLGHMLDCKDGGCSPVVCGPWIQGQFFDLTIIDDPTGQAWVEYQGIFPAVCIPDGVDLGALGLKYASITARVFDNFFYSEEVEFPLVRCHSCCENLRISGSPTVNPGSTWVGTVYPACEGATVGATLSEALCPIASSINATGDTVQITPGASDCGTIEVTVSDPDGGCPPATKRIRINNTGQGGTWRRDKGGGDANWSTYGDASHVGYCGFGELADDPVPVCFGAKFSLAAVVCDEDAYKYGNYLGASDHCGADIGYWCAKQFFACKDTKIPPCFEDTHLNCKDRNLNCQYAIWGDKYNCKGSQPCAHQYVASGRCEWYCDDCTTTTTTTTTVTTTLTTTATTITTTSLTTTTITTTLTTTTITTTLTTTTLTTTQTCTTTTLTTTTLTTTTTATTVTTTATTTTVSSIYVYPNAKVAVGGTEWGDIGDCGDKWSCVSDGCASPDDDNMLYTSDWVATNRFDTTNPSFSGTCKSIRVCVRGARVGTNNTITISIYDGAVQIGGNKTITITSAMATFANYWSGWWTGLSKSSANLSDLRVQIVSQATECYVSELTVEMSVTAL